MRRATTQGGMHAAPALGYKHRQKGGHGTREHKDPTPPTLIAQGGDGT